MAGWFLFARKVWSWRALGVLGLLFVGLVTGCGSPTPGPVDIDAIRRKSIAEGKGDPIPVAPTTLEERKARADRLIKEARERKEAREKQKAKP